jgi:hypothetical protein
MQLEESDNSKDVPPLRRGAGLGLSRFGEKNTVSRLLPADATTGVLV